MGELSDLQGEPAPAFGRGPSRYRNAGEHARVTIAGRAAGGRLNMLFAGASVSEEAARLGVLLDRIVGSDRATGHRHYSFFSNSAEEALFGAIKLLRHNAVVTDEASTGCVLVVDARDRCPDDAMLWCLTAFPDLHTGVDVVYDCDDAVRMLGSGDYVAVVVVSAAGSCTSALRVREFAARSGILVALARFHTMRSAADLRDDGPIPNVFVFGENLGNYQVPFGCMVATAATYSVWNNVTDSLAHTSTFGANGNCLHLVEEHLQLLGAVDDNTESVLLSIACDRTTRNLLFRRYVNPCAGGGLEMFGQDLDVSNAQGMLLTLRDGETVYDCAGGTGASLRGHNPDKAIAGVLAHESGHDYFADLEIEMRAQVGNVQLFPAVSGATAVDNALYLASLASPGKTVLTFKGNYSGKTLPSIALSKYGPQRSASHPRAFAPYSASVIYIDAFAADARQQFSNALERYDVGLVWCELIQGMQCRHLPAELLAEITRGREVHGYAIGIDEVLTGYHRVGTNLLYQSDLGIRADVTTLAKPMSDMLLPFGVTLATDEFVERAMTTNKRAVQQLRVNYLNQLGCHIALESLRCVVEASRSGHIDQAKALARSSFDSAVATSRVFSAVAGSGLLLRLVPNRRWFPEPSTSTVGQTLEASLQDLMLQTSGVLLAQQRLFPPLVPPQEEFAEAMHRIAETSREITIPGVYFNTVRRITDSEKHKIAHKRRERKRRRQQPPEQPSNRETMS